MDYLNLHYYDGKVSYESSNNSYSQEDFQKFLEYISPKFPENNPLLRMFIEKIISDFLQFGRNENSPNYDPSNKCYACELLLISWDILKKDESLLPLFFEQIEDMQTGFCPPGRTTRLLQFILPHFFHEEKEKEKNEEEKNQD